MQLGMIGLGRMGGNMVRRLMRGGPPVRRLRPRTRRRSKRLPRTGSGGTSARRSRSPKLEPPRAVWVMLPAGEIDRAHGARSSRELLEPDDIVIDGGNSYLQGRHPARRRAASRRAFTMSMSAPAAASGVWSAAICMMIGGDEGRRSTGSIRSSPRSRPASATFRARPAARAAIPASSGVISIAARAAPAISSKMVHNGIEYGLMQAYAEGFDILAARRVRGPAGGTALRSSTSPTSPRSGGAAASSRSWLLDLTADRAAAGPGRSKPTRASSRIRARAAGR